MVGSWDNYIYLYSMECGRLIDKIYAHDDAVSLLCLEGQTLVSASYVHANP